MTAESKARARSRFRRVLHDESGQNWRGELAERSDASLAEVLSKLTQDTASDTDSGSSASPAQEQTRLEQRTSAKLPGVSQSSKRPARWSMLRASSISGACAVRTKEMSRILSIPAAVLTDERS